MSDPVLSIGSTAIDRDPIAWQSVRTPMSANAEPTGSGSFFLEQATRLQQLLDRDFSPRGRTLVAEAQRLGLLFVQWASVRPDPAMKAAAIRDLFELNRAVMEHVGAASGVRPSAPSLPNLDDDD